MTRRTPLPPLVALTVRRRAHWDAATLDAVVTWLDEARAMIIAGGDGNGSLSDRFTARLSDRLSDPRARRRADG